jgi:predicted transcriptional regulator
MEKLYTIKELSKKMNRDRHTVWYHVKKLGVGKLVGRMFVLTQQEFDHVLNKAYCYNLK